MRSKKTIIVLTTVVVMAALWGGYEWLGLSQPADGTQKCATVKQGHADQVYIPAGQFKMGSEAGYPEEGPVTEVAVDGFWIDAYEVTNAQFAKFVDETGYITLAERAPRPEDFPDIPADKLVAGAVVFVPPTDFSKGMNPLSWWRYIAGADWRHPEGPDSTIEGRAHFPVVNVAHADALAYARWAGRDLPTEEQWEYAARGGLEGATYAWGEELTPDGQSQANHWQGIFPVQNTREDGFVGAAPVGCFKPNGYGLFDMIGNVWEWTNDYYYPAHNITPPPSGTGYDPRQPQVAVRVIKGGSFLCAPNYCLRYRPSARHSQETGLGTDHVGFRTVSNAPAPAGL